MATALKFFKVLTLPGTLQSHAVYFVRNNTYSETYVTDTAGTAYAVGNSAMINALVDAKLGTVNNLIQVATIAARDTHAATVGNNQMYLVTDATGDPTVASGAALYFYNDTTTTHTKVAEYESMDMTVQWANIQGKPSSTAAAIDDAVSKRHDHSNKATLDKLGEASGALTFNGSAVTTDWASTDW